MEFLRKKADGKTVIAICYDFDKTLSPDDMQAQGYIQDVGFDVRTFWEEATGLAYNHDMDTNLAYMYKMVQEAEGNLVLTKKALADYGAKVKLYDGVVDWFRRINEYGKKRDVVIEHYVISSGLKEMIEGTLPYKNGDFERVYASCFYFNERGVAKWPAQAVNFTNKTQFLFRICKGTLDVNDPAVNDYFKSEEIRIPFKRMIYIGDSDTDVPCMKLVNSYGGYSIGVFDREKNDLSKVRKMLADKRISRYAAADYTEGSQLDKTVKHIIDEIAKQEVEIPQCGDIRYMQMALAEARQAELEDEVPIGAVIVKDGKVIATAHNRKEAKNNAVCHAEIEAITQASEKLENWYLEGCELYVTLEPCPMCVGAIINSRIDRVYFGAYDPKAGAAGSLYNLFAENRFNHRVECYGGIMKKECGDILTDYFRKRRG